MHHPPNHPHGFVYGVDGHVYDGPPPNVGLPPPPYFEQIHHGQDFAFVDSVPSAPFGFGPHSYNSVPPMQSARRANSTGHAPTMGWAPAYATEFLPPGPPKDGAKPKPAHVHRPTLDPIQAEVVRAFFHKFEDLPENERQRLRDRWIHRGRPAVEILEQYLVHEAKTNCRPMKPFVPLPPPRQALTENDFGSPHRLNILLHSMLELPDISLSLKNMNAFTMGAEADRRPRTIFSDFYRWPCLRKSLRSAVLDDVTVHYAPGGMHLVLGPPLSGKTALLRALAGRFKGSNTVVAHVSAALGGRPLVVNGQQLENGKHKLLEKRNPLLYAEADQYERHIPTLSVYETVDFANVLRSIELHKLPNAGAIEKILLPALSRLRSRGLLELFGLQGSAETMVGDGVVVRGVSGGQRRRVTSAEPLAGIVRVVLLDVPTNGLDTATAAEICRDIRVLGYALRQTIVMALMQPPPEVFTLFTTVTMLDEGAVVYHGPIASAEQYFKCLGFQRPKGVDLADFLIDMCTHRRERFFQGSGRGLQGFRPDGTVHGRNWAEGQPADFKNIDYGLIKKRAAEDPSHAQYSGWVMHGGNDALPPPPACSPMGSMGPHGTMHSTYNPYMGPTPVPMGANGAIAYQVPQEMVGTVIGAPGQPVILPPPDNRGLLTRILDRVLGRDPKPSIWFNDPSVINTIDATAINFETVPAVGPGGNVRRGGGGNSVVDGEDVLTRNGLQALWNKSILHTDTVKAIEKAPQASEGAEQSWLYKTKWATARGTQFRTLMARQWAITTRTPAFLIGRCIGAIFIGLILGTLFYGVPNTYEFATARVGLLFFVSMSVGFGSFNNVGPWIQERQVFNKQHRLHFFKVAPFVGATTLMALPASLLEGFLMGTLVWWLCLPNPMFYRYLYFVIVLILLSFMIASMLRCISVVAKTEVMGSALAVLIVLGQVVFCGFVLPIRKIPPWMIWLYWGNPVKWALEAIAIIVLNKQTFYCPPEQLVTVYEVPPSMIGAVTDQGIDWALMPDRVIQTNSTTTPTFTTSLTSYQACPFTTGREALDALGFFQDEFWIFANMAILLGMTILMIILATIFLKIIKHDDEHSVRFPMQRVQPDGELPECPPIPLIWRGITYAVTVNGGWKPLITNVSGYALPGTMTALMGESGAGKTTLMDVVAHRKLQGKAEGLIMLGEHDVSSGLPTESTKAAGFAKPEHGIGDLLKAACSGDKEAQKALRGKEKRRALLLFKASTGYVLQFDTLCPFETVYESVEFSAALRLVGISREERKKRIDMCIRLLELEPVAGVQVGGGSGITGVSDSQRKLTSIAVELVANPPVLFLDEPTTGLDPQGALVVIEALRRIADQGRAVLATIHQPSMRLFTAFDRLLLLKRGGHTVYFGPLHSEGPGQDVPAKYAKGKRPSPSDIKRKNDAKRVEDCGLLRRYFAKYDGVPECGDEQNPASWMLDVIGAGASASNKQDFAALWTHSPEGHAAKRDVDALVSSYNPSLPSATTQARRDVFRLAEDKPHSKDDHEGHDDDDNHDGHGHLDPRDNGATNPYGHQGAMGVGMPMGFHGAYPGAPQHPGAMQPGAQGRKPMVGDCQADHTEEPRIRPGFFTQLAWVTWRVARMFWRAPDYTFQGVLMSLALGLLFGFSYWRMENDIVGVQAIIGYTFISMMFMFAMSAAVTLPFWFAHKPCYNREALGTRMYHPITFGLALTFIDFFFVLAKVAAFAGPAYWLIGLDSNAGTFWTYFFLIFISVLWGSCFGQLLVFWKQTVADAQMFFGLLIPLTNLFCGFIIRRTQIPPVWIWLYYANPFRWMMEALVICIVKPIKHIDCSSLHNLDVDPMLVVDCPTKTGEESIRAMDMWPNMLWPDVAIFLGGLVAIRLLGFLALVTVKPPAT